jgi:hypothetical protein
MYQEYGLSEGVPGDELAGLDAADLDALSEVRSGQFVRVLCHSLSAAVDRYFC